MQHYHLLNMTTLAIILGALSVFFIVTGIIALVNQVRSDTENLLLPWILLSIGSIELFLCLTI